MMIRYMIRTSYLEWSDIDWMLNHENHEDHGNQDHEHYEGHTLPYLFYQS